MDLFIILLDELVQLLITLQVLIAIDFQPLQFIKYDDIIDIFNIIIILNIILSFFFILFIYHRIYISLMLLINKYM
jgi:hypothetical protein